MTLPATLSRDRRMALLGCSGHGTQSSVDGAPSCLGHAAVGTWAGLANDGTLVDTVPRVTLPTDCTFSSGMQRGTWTASPGGHELVMTWDGAFSPQAAYVSGDRMLIGVEGRLSNGGSPGNPSGTTWTWTSSACCANGSPFSVAWDLSLDPSGSYIEHGVPSSFQGPTTMTCSGTWLAKSLGFDLKGTADACGPTTRRFVWLDSDIGGGYQRAAS